MLMVSAFIHARLLIDYLAVSTNLSADQFMVQWIYYNLPVELVY